MCGLINKVSASQAADCEFEARQRQVSADNFWMESLLLNKEFRNKNDAPQQKYQLYINKT